MINIINKIKDNFNALLGNPEYILKLAKNALKQIDGVQFYEKDGILERKVAGTDTFSKNVIWRFIPEKNKLILNVIIDAFPSDDYNEKVSKYKFNNPILKGTTIKDQPAISLIIDGSDLKNVESLSKLIECAIKGVEKEITDFGVSLDLVLVKTTPNAIRDALKGCKDLELSNVTSINKSAGNGVFVIVKDDKLKSYKLRFSCYEWCIYPSFYLSKVSDSNAALNVFSKNNLKAIRLEDDSIKVCGEFDYNALRSINILRTNLIDYIDALSKSLNEINEVNPLGDTQLRDKQFDCYGIEEYFLDLEEYDNYDPKGTVKLIKKRGNGFKYDIATIVNVLPSKVTICCKVDAKLTISSENNRILSEFNVQSGLDARIINNGTLEVIGVEDASSYQNNYAALQYGLEHAAELYKQVFSATLSLLTRFGVDLYEFVPNAVIEILKTINGFDKVKDGDVNFLYPETDEFFYKRFMWIYIHPDKLKFQMGISGFKTGMPIDQALGRVKNEFSGKNDGVDYVKFGEDTIRIEKMIYRRDLSDDKIENQIKKGAELTIEELKNRIVEVAKICDIPMFVLNEFAFGKACLRAGMSKVDSIYESSYCRFSLTSDAEIMVYVKRDFRGKAYNLTGSLESELKKLDKRINKVKFFYGENAELYFSPPNYTDFNSLVSDLKDLIGIGNKADDLVIAYNKKADAIAEEKRRQEREERERAAEQRRREQELNSSFWMEFNEDTEVRWILKTFNNNYPYLRLGIYMVKTGQSADRYGDTIASYDNDTTMRQIRSFKNGGRITIYGRSTPQDIERDFRQIYGLVVKVCYTDSNKNRYYISKGSSWYKTSIAEIQRKLKDDGCYYNDWY
ncbi:MAG: hypothetical protein HDS83_02900 [Bacteroidales bacterium]|nr:hypothetical protein [Bacteroidales bacterium]